MEKIYLKESWASHEAHLKTMVPEISLIESMLDEVIGSSRGTTGEMCAHLLRSGGKRLRPLLVILSGKVLVPSAQDRLITAGIAAELIHMASLVHDDIIDQSLYRRGQAALHTLWGQKNAVLAGDFLFAKAFDLLVAEGLFPVLKLMVEAIQEMCRGEIDQSNQLFCTELTEEDYFRRIYQKTAKFLAVCCEAGALVSGAEAEARTALKIYGTNLGYTFQIIDDLLDFTGQSETLGKPVCQDLIQGNLTLPVLYLLQDAQHGPWARDVIGRKRLHHGECTQIASLLKETGLLDQARSVARHCADTAKDALAEISPGMYRSLLESMVDKALERNA